MIFFIWKLERRNIRETFLKKGEIIPLNTDFVFTSIFNNQENIEILEAFLSIYLDDNNI